MRRRVFFWTAAAVAAVGVWLAVAGGVFGGKAVPCDVETVRVMSYNIRNAIGMDGVTDDARIAEAIRRVGPDVVALQEVDSMTRRSAGRYVAGGIARALGMHDVFGAAIPYEGGGYGVAILSRERPCSVRRVPLPGREEARMLLVAEFPDYVLGCVHLSLTEEDRLASVETIRCEAARFEKPFILAGDWNDGPDSELLARLAAAGFRTVTDTTQPTHPADRPRVCIDYIALHDPFGAVTEVSDAGVVEEPLASDHRPVVATLRFENR